MTKAIDPGKLAFVVGDKNEGLKKAQTAEAAGKGAQAQAEASQIAGKSNPLSPLYSPTEAALNLGTAPGAAQIQTGQTAQAGRVAGAQAGARFPYEMQLERVRQQVAQSQQVMQPDIPMDEMSMSDYLKARKRGR